MNITKHPPRKWIFAGSVLEDFKRDEDFVEYLSLQENDAILEECRAWHREFYKKQLAEKDKEINEYHGRLITWESKCHNLQSRLAVALDVVEEYASHKDRCNVYLGASDEAECNCGLVEALEKNRGHKP